MHTIGCTLRLEADKVEQPCQLAQIHLASWHCSCKSLQPRGSRVGKSRWQQLLKALRARQMHTRERSPAEVELGKHVEIELW